MNRNIFQVAAPCQPRMGRDSIAQGGALGSDSMFGASPEGARFQWPETRPDEGISHRWGFTFLLATQPRANATRAIESRPLGAELATGSPKTSRQAARCCGLVALLAAAWLAADLAPAQEKSRHAERRSRRSQAVAEAAQDSASVGPSPVSPNQGSPNQGDVEQAQSDADQSALTLRDVINFAAESRAAVKDVKDYTVVFNKTEMVKKLVIKQEMQMKFRAKPFSVYFLYRGGSAEGRQAIYVEGRNDNKLIVKEASGIASYVGGGVYLRLSDPRVMAENRYPVTNVGIANLLETSIRDWEHESKVAGAEVDVLFFPNAKLKDLPCQAVQVKHLKKHGDLKYHMNRVYFDKETKLPVRSERFGWPTRAGEKPPLVEEYRYTNLKTNVKLTDADFDPVRYGF